MSTVNYDLPVSRNKKHAHLLRTHKTWQAGRCGGGWCRQVCFDGSSITKPSITNRTSGRFAHYRLCSLPTSVPFPDPVPSRQPNDFPTFISHSHPAVNKRGLFPIPSLEKNKTKIHLRRARRSHPVPGVPLTTSTASTTMPYAVVSLWATQI